MLRNNGPRKDLTNLIGHLTATIVMNEREEEFYRRSGEATTRDDIKTIMLEIAGNLAQSRLQLEAHREILRQALSQLVS